MATTVTVRAYLNTGFDLNNIPSSPTALNLVGDSNIRTFPSVSVRQEYVKQDIRIDGEWDDCKNIDYIELVAPTNNRAFYVVSEVVMLSQRSARLTIYYDPICSIGGITNILIIGGIVERRHVVDDILGRYNTPEPFIPSHPFRVDVSDSFFGKDSNTTPLTFAISSVNLTALGYAAETFIDSNTGLSVAVPLVPAIETSATYTINYQSGTDDYEYYYKVIPNQAIFDMNDSDVRAGIQHVRSIGVEGAIQDTMTIDPAWVQDLITKYGLLGAARTHRTSLAINDGFGTINNQKAFSGQFQKWTLKNMSSGDSIQFDMEDILDYDANGDVNYNPICYGFCDPSPGGRPYARPHYKGSRKNCFNMAVSGSTWEKVPITYSENSAQFQADLRQKFANVQSVINVTQSAATGLAGASVGDSRAVAEGLGGLASSAVEVAQRELDYQITKEVVTPDVHFPMSTSLSNYTGNAFVWVKTYLHNDDVIYFDRFLSMYGYAVGNERLSMGALNCRTNYNYIKTRDAHIKTAHGLWVDRLIQRVLDSGIRLWHVLPNPDLYNQANPVRS